MRPIDPPPKALLCDLDDTLCDYASARAERLRRAFSHGLGLTDEPHGIDLDRMIEESIAIHPHGADHFPELFARHGFHDPVGARMAIDWYRTHRFHGLDLFPNTAAILQAARHLEAPNGLRPIGIITNGPAEVQRAKVELLGVSDLVDFVIISGEFGVAKPAPEIFHEALRRAGVSAAEAVFIGDSPEFDIAGARGVGIPAVWVNASGGAWRGEGPPPDWEIKSIAELPRLLAPAQDL